MNMIYTIYKGTNKINGKVYIGYTNNFERRVKEHSKLRNIKTHFQYAIKKHGYDNFEWSIIYQSKDQEHCLNEMEKYFIEEYQSNLSKKGYNGTNGGEGGIQTPEVRAKMSMARKGRKLKRETVEKIRKANTGKKRSDEIRAKMRIALKGHFVSEETKRKLSKIKSGENNPMYGRKHTQEVKDKISDINKGNTYNLGKKRTDEEKRNISIANTGKKRTEEHKKKMSIAFTGKNNPRYGKEVSQETRDRISNANKGKKRSEEFKARLRTYYALKRLEKEKNRQSS